MNQNNFEYLRDQVKFTGFGDALEKELQTKLQKQAPEFQLAYQAKLGHDTVEAALHFKKSDQSDMYFFNRYQLTIKPEPGSDPMEQTFYINKGNNITLKEAYNLMSGRAVNKDLLSKEGQLYNAWLQMDFKQTDPNGNHKMKQFHQNYGFDLEQTLAKHPIKELGEEQDKSRLLESLQKGNRQAVTFVQESKEQKHFIEANPQFKTITIYDSNMQRLNRKQAPAEKETAAPSIRQEARKSSLKQETDTANQTTSSIARKRGKRNGKIIS